MRVSGPLMEHQNKSTVAAESAAIPRGSSSLEFRRLRRSNWIRPIAQKDALARNPGKKYFQRSSRAIIGQEVDNNIHQTCRGRIPATRRFSVSCDVLGPFFLSHGPIGNNVNGVGVCSLDRLRWLPIATIKQRACSRNSRSSWRFWIAHYLRKRFDGRSRIIAGGILNIGQDFRSSVRISRLARFEACASRSPWHLPDIAC